MECPGLYSRWLLSHAALQLLGIFENEPHEYVRRRQLPWFKVLLGIHIVNHVENVNAVQDDCHQVSHRRTIGPVLRTCHRARHQPKSSLNDNFGSLTIREDFLQEKVR